MSSGVYTSRNRLVAVEKLLETVIKWASASGEPAIKSRSVALFSSAVGERQPMITRI